MTNVISKFLAVIGIIASVSVAQAAPETAAQIMKKAQVSMYYAGDDGRTAARMVIVDDKGNKQLRQFTLLRKDTADGGEQDMLVFFSRPADIKGTVFRVQKVPGKDDNRWLYLPGLDLIKRISAGDKRTSFVGSHFFYEDISGRNPELDTFTLLKETDTNYRIKGVPNAPDTVEFSHYIATVNKFNYLATDITFYDKQDNAYRTIESLAVKDIDGFATTVKSKVTDLISKGSTTMEFRFSKYNLGLPSSIFNERSMKTPPKKYLSRR